MISFECAHSIFGTTMNGKSSQAYETLCLYKFSISTLRVKLLLILFILIFLVFIKHANQNDLDGTQFFIWKTNLKSTNY